MGTGTKPQRSSNDQSGYKPTGAWAPGFHASKPLLEMSRTEIAFLSAVLGIGFMLVLWGLGSIIGSLGSPYGSLILLAVVSGILVAAVFLASHLRTKHEEMWRSERGDILSS
jgi:hypothetical protein